MFPIAVGEIRKIVFYICCYKRLIWCQPLRTYDAITLGNYKSFSLQPFCMDYKIVVLYFALRNWLCYSLVFYRSLCTLRYKCIKLHCHNNLFCNFLKFFCQHFFTDRHIFIIYFFKFFYTMNANNREKIIVWQRIGLFLLSLKPAYYKTNWLPFKVINVSYTLHCYLKKNIRSKQ